MLESVRETNAPPNNRSAPIDDDGPIKRFGFAYGTLDHAESGEARFAVEWDQQGDDVY